MKLIKTLTFFLIMILACSAVTADISPFRPIYNSFGHHNQWYNAIWTFDNTTVALNYRMFTNLSEMSVNMSASNITASHFFGDGSELIGIMSGINMSLIIDNKLNDSLDFESNNISDIYMIEGRDSNPVQIGSGTPNAHSLTSPNDLDVIGKLGVGGGTYFDGTVICDNTLRMNDDKDINFGGSDDSRIDWSTGQTTENTMVWALGDTSKSIIFTKKSNAGKDYDHSAFDDPTLVLQANENPDHDNQRFTTLSHSNNTNEFQINTGIGASVKILPNTTLHNTVNIEADIIHGDRNNVELGYSQINGTHWKWEIDINYIEKGFHFNSNLTIGGGKHSGITVADETGASVCIKCWSDRVCNNTAGSC